MDAARGVPAGPDQEIGVVRQESPRHDTPALRRPRRDPVDDIGPVPLVPDEGGPLDLPHHAMVEDAGGIEAGAPGHARQFPVSRPRKQNITVFAAA